MQALYVRSARLTARTIESPGCFASLRSEQGAAPLAPLCGYPCGLCGGANYLFGLGQGITATLTVQKQTLMVTYSDAEWTGKIIGIAVGWFLCLIPFITGIIGAVRQSKLPDTITADIQCLISSGYEETQTNQ